MTTSDKEVVLKDLVETDEVDNNDCCKASIIDVSDNLFDAQLMKACVFAPGPAAEKYSYNADM